MSHDMNWTSGIIAVSLVIIALILYAIIHDARERDWRTTLWNLGYSIKENVIALAAALLVTAILAAITYGLGFVINFIWGLFR